MLFGQVFQPGRNVLAGTQVADTGDVAIARQRAASGRQPLLIPGDKDDRAPPFGSGQSRFDARYRKMRQ